MAASMDPLAGVEPGHHRRGASSTPASTPEELLGAVHPSLVGNTQGSGMGGMSSIQTLYRGSRPGRRARQRRAAGGAGQRGLRPRQRRAYVGGYGPMVHPVAACATAAVSLEEAVDKIRPGQGRGHRRRRLGRPEHRGHQRVRRHDRDRRQRRAWSPPGSRPTSTAARATGAGAGSSSRRAAARFVVCPRLGGRRPRPAGARRGRLRRVVRRRHPHLDPGPRPGCAGLGPGRGGLAAGPGAGRPRPGRRRHRRGVQARHLDRGQRPERGVHPRPDRRRAGPHRPARRCWSSRRSR